MQLSRKPIPDKQWELIWDKLIALFGKTIHSNDMETLLSGVLAPAERVMMGKRLMVFVLSMADWSATEISDVLRLSRSTVYKYLTMIEGDDELQRVLNKTVKPLRKTEKKIDRTDPASLEGFLEAFFEGRQKRSKLQY